MKHLLFLLAFISPLSFADNYSPQKVVYHVNYADHSRINATIANIRNHLDAVGESNSDIKVVTHGPAIEYLQEAINNDDYQIKLDELRFRGVQFVICGNTLSAYGLSGEQLYEVEDSDIVTAGLPEIVKLQQAGYIYVRP